MNEKFLKLRQSKQKIILQAAISEFACAGYDKASTDNIVSSAGISKGSLFNYFISKKGLYEDVVSYIIERLEKEAMGEIKKIEEGDFYNRLKQITVIKYKYMNKYPLEAKILKDYISNNSGKSNEKVDYYRHIETNHLEKHLITYLDMSLLKEGLDIEDVLFVTMTVLQAVLKRQEELTCVEPTAENVTVMEKELDKYIDLLKYGMYRGC